jgi:predicted DNA-binding protein
MTNPASKTMREAINHSLNAMEMISFNEGFEAAANALDELSDAKHNQQAHGPAEVLRWAAMQLRGENV